MFFNYLYPYAEQNLVTWPKGTASTLPGSKAKAISVPSGHGLSLFAVFHV